MSSDFYVTPPRDVNEGNLVSNVPMYCAPEWNSSIALKVGQFTYRTGLFYRLTKAAGSSTDPAINPQNWQVVTDELLYAPWKMGETYALGQRIAVNYIRGDNFRENAGKIYQSLVAGNTGNNPEESPDEWLYLNETYQPLIPGTGNQAGIKGLRIIYIRNVYEMLVDNALGADPSTSSGWLYIGPADRWAMFDSLTSTQTVMPIDIINTIQVSGRIDTIGLINISGTSVNVTVMDGATEVYNKTIELSDDVLITDWWEYYFGDFYYRSSLFLRDIPTIMNPAVTVTVYGSGTSERAIGHLLLGQSFYIGKTEMGADVGIENYSRIVTNEFGERSIVERGYSDQGNFKVIVDRNRTDAVKKVLTDLRATPCLYVATDTLDSTIYFGLASFRVGFEYPFHSRVSISVEGF